MDCNAKHTPYQPTEDEWKCPKCGAGVNEGNGFMIDSEADGVNGECTKIHMEDELRCFECGYVSYGKAFAARLQKLHNLVPCSCCKGTGLVKKTE